MDRKRLPLAERWKKLGTKPIVVGRSRLVRRHLLRILVCFESSRDTCVIPVSQAGSQENKITRVTLHGVKFGPGYRFDVLVLEGS